MIDRFAKLALYSLVAAILAVPAYATVVTPTVKVTPASSSVTTAQSLQVTIAVSGTKGTPAGTVKLSSGSYASAAATLSSGSASITIPAGSLPAGTDTLTAKYTPGSTSSATYGTASGTASVTVTVPTTSVTVKVDVLANRHGVSPYIYGGAFPNSLAEVTDSGNSLVRWGGNATSNYNWKLKTYNAGNDWYFEDFNTGGTSGGDSVQFVTDIHNAGSHALTTMPMMAWVAKSAENGTNGHWSYPVAKYGKQCSADPYNADAGNGLKSDCSTAVTTAAVTGAYYPLLDTASQACPSGGCIYRDEWAKALATAFGTGTCTIPGTTITSCHFYDMDNEMDIWGGTHRDVHPKPSGYDELANIYVKEAAALKQWDPAAVRLGPVSCCWWFYWNGANGNDKAAHGGVDFLPWWLNQVYWLDKIHGARTLDIFDIHAYPDADTGGLSTAQLQALSASIYRDYWDPTYTSTAGVVTQPWSTSVEPKYSIPFRIPRMKAMVNAIYPGTPLSFTEWSAAFYNENDFSTALGDADAYGIFGRENLALATRWVAPVSGNPNYLALKLYANYDGSHHTFGTVSISDKNSRPTLFSSYAALNSSGTSMTVMVLNKDPKTAAKVTFTLAGFTPSTYKVYKLASSAPTKITAVASAAWSATQTFAPYTATLLVITGSEVAKPVSEWYVNPDDLMIPASGIATLHPTIRSGSAAVTLHSAVFDAYEGAAACAGSLVITNSAVASGKPGAITVNAPSTPGFCHYTVTGSDGTVTQSQGGWIVVGNPAGTLTVTSGNSQAAAAGTALPKPLTVTLSPGQSGGSAQGAEILFTTSAGTLTYGTTTGTSVIATVNSSGLASVTLKLPSTKGTVTVTAQDQFAFGGSTVKFTETAQ